MSALADGDFFLGQFSYADLMLLAAFKWVELIVGADALFDGKTAPLGRWYRRVQDRLGL